MSNFTWGFLILGKTSKTIEDLAVTKEKEEQEKVKNKPRVTYSKVTSCVLIEEIRRFFPSCSLEVIPDPTDMCKTSQTALFFVVFN